MKNITLLYAILKDTKNLITSSEFKEAFSLGNSFSELCRLFVDRYYNLNKNLATWNGFNISSVEGTSLQVPDTKECGQYVGLSSNQNDTKTAVATVSSLYDIVVEARITKFKTSERLIAKQHIETIDNTFYPQKSIIIILDRGYPSYDMFDYLNSKKLLFFQMKWQKL